jgi:hypothetical protein
MRVGLWRLDRGATDILGRVGGDAAVDVSEAVEPAGVGPVGDVVLSSLEVWNRRRLVAVAAEFRRGRP